VGQRVIAMQMTADVVDPRSQIENDTVAGGDDLCLAQGSACGK
jgi:hypothetical protein